MSRYLSIIFFALAVQLMPQQAMAQRFLDPTFYLLDSIEADKVSAADLKLMDSLLTRFHNAKQDTIKTFALSGIIENSYDEKIWTRYNVYLKTFAEEKLRDKTLNKKTVIAHQKILSSCYNNIGYLHKQHGEIKKALYNYNQAQAILRKINNHNGLGTNYNNIGYIYFDQGNIPLAIEFFHKAIEHYRLSDNINTGPNQVLDQIAIVYNNLGLLHSRQTDYKRALNYYEKALEIKLKTKEPSGLSLAYGNIGGVYIKHNKLLCAGDQDPDCARKLFDKGMQYLRKSVAFDLSIGFESNVARTYHNIAMGFSLSNQPDSSICYFERSISIKRKYKDLSGLCLSLTQLGSIRMNQGDKVQAKKNLSEAYAYAQKLGFPESIAMSTEALSKLYEKENNYREAFLYYKTFIKMRDSTVNEKNTRAAVQRDMEFEYRKKQATDSISNAKKAEVQDARIQAQESQLNSERNKKIAMFTGLLSVLVVLFLIYNRFRSTQKQKNLILEQKNLVEEKQREIIDSINYAQRLQNAILAKESEIKKVFPDFFLLYLPKDIVAGDFYFFDVTDTHAFYAAADCTGHGVPGAMVSVICSNALSQSINEFRITEPGKILDRAREIILETFKKSGEHVKDGMDISLLAKDLRTGHYTWAGANNSLFVYDALQDNTYEVKADKQPVGYTENPQPFITHTLQLNKNDCVFMYTDGFHDQFGGEKGKKLKKINFYNELKAGAKEEPAEIKKRIHRVFNQWKGNHPQLDDVCVIGIKV